MLWFKRAGERTSCQYFIESQSTNTIPYKKVMIRDQVTRWGSCTSDKSISLNFKLLFLPLNLVTHIIIP